jgi:hypothetical protein
VVKSSSSKFGSDKIGAYFLARHFPKRDFGKPGARPIARLESKSRTIVKKGEGDRGDQKRSSRYWSSVR